MTTSDRLVGQLLAEVIRLQRWAGGDSVPAARIFGLLHGFETILDDERTDGISAATQRAVEDMLEAVEAGKQSTDSLAIKGRLKELHVSETDADLVMQLCLLESRFVNGVKMIAGASGSRFVTPLRFKAADRDWRGALHYVELYDTTEGVRKKLHAAFAPCVPRIGDVIVPESGSRMCVVAVEHWVTALDDCAEQRLLTPYIVLEPIGDDDPD